MYICVSRNKKGKVDRALYYNKKLGRVRVYRQSFPLQEANANFELLKYKRKANARNSCDFVNKSFGENFEVANL